jgi:hypothetical protein
MSPRQKARFVFFLAIFLLISSGIAASLSIVNLLDSTIRQVRPKLACAGCDRIVQAPAPSRPIQRSIAGPGLLAHVRWSRSIAIIFRCTANRRSTHGKAWKSIARHWRNGWAERVGC